MTTYRDTTEFENARFIKASFRGATMRATDLSGVTMRAVNTNGLDIDDHDLFSGSV